MRETRLSGSEGGATLIWSSLPLSIIASLRDVVSPHRPRKRGSAPGCHAVFSTRRLLTRYTPRDEPAATCSSGADAPTTG
jgi:hypothetical protein